MPFGRSEWCDSSFPRYSPGARYRKRSEQIGNQFAGNPFLLHSPGPQHQLQAFDCESWWVFRIPVAEVHFPEPRSDYLFLGGEG